MFHAPGTVPRVAELIPRKILFGNPDRGSPEVAPDGRRLAHLAPVDDVLNVWVGDLDGNGARPVTHSYRMIPSPYWSLAVLTVSGPSICSGAR